jgi:hypothetical protein
MAPTPAAPVRAMGETPTRSSTVDAARKLSLARAREFADHAVAASDGHQQCLGRPP